MKAYFSISAPLCPAPLADLGCLPPPTADQALLAWPCTRQLVGTGRLPPPNSPHSLRQKAGKGRAGPSSSSSSAAAGRWRRAEGRWKGVGGKGLAAECGAVKRAGMGKTNGWGSPSGGEQSRIREDKGPRLKWPHPNNCNWDYRDCLRCAVGSVMSRRMTFHSAMEIPIPNQVAKPGLLPFHGKA